LQKRRAQGGGEIEMVQEHSDHLRAVQSQSQSQSQMHSGHDADCGIALMRSLGFHQRWPAPAIGQDTSVFWAGGLAKQLEAGTHAAGWPVASHPFPPAHTATLPHLASLHLT
jgi:hypothetical protein